MRKVKDPKPFVTFKHIHTAVPTQLPMKGPAIGFSKKLWLCPCAKAFESMGDLSNHIGSGECPEHKWRLWPR